MVRSFPSYLSLNISKKFNFELQTRNFCECSQYRFADRLRSRTLEKDEIVLFYVACSADICAVPVKRLRMGIQKLVPLSWIFHRKLESYVIGWRVYMHFKGSRYISSNFN